MKTAALTTLMPLCFVLAWLSTGETTTLDKTYHLIFSGDACAQISGRCTVVTSGGEALLTLDGQVPHEKNVVGRRLSCQLQADGRVVIDIEHGGSRTLSATNGGSVNIRLR